MVQIFSMSEKISENEVLEFEDKLGARFPEDYRQFLVDNNVCSIDPYGFFYKHEKDINDDDKPKGELGIFYGFTEKEERCLEWVKSIYHDNGRIPRKFFPIAIVGGGSNICIGISGSERGKIYLWNHENESQDDLRCLADSFSEFLKSLR